MGVLTLECGVLEHLWAYRQAKPWKKEAGGQLFARFTQGQVCISVATGPRKADKRSLFGYVPDSESERIEIEAHFSQGLHFVGDWHTHRQKIPEPSSTDIESITGSVRKSDHVLFGFVLIVVGTAVFPKGLSVSLHTTESWETLELK